MYSEIGLPHEKQLPATKSCRKIPRVASKASPLCACCFAGNGRNDFRRLGLQYPSKHFYRIFQPAGKTLPAIAPLGCFILAPAADWLSIIHHGSGVWRRCCHAINTDKILAGILVGLCELLGKNFQNCTTAAHLADQKFENNHFYAHLMITGQARSHSFKVHYAFKLRLSILYSKALNFISCIK